ncbi:DUF1996 domain-containing protein [Streptomyces olivochromogenes]|uniref:DUF1996 domain-containing protein n=1 Tax=Streptomyces olivochromogenes TaxID=1963 RepID=A0A250V9Z7_STROL|nr:DUF1996 domain-containing protein [Streptomyces olivochromogenes]KUN48507.1 hypothetical protein AQJ27_07085 [Streptomyces olivochromogenes]GAX50856.1 hypothetical protein SO3561_02355 [Streptomyces olivochromogenes]
MGRNTRKRRSPLAVRAVAASAALAIGGGGLIWANFYASAHESNSSPNTTKAAAAQVATISCPDVGQKLTSVPANAKSNVDSELATLDKQITEAYARLASSRQAQANDAGFVQNAILSPLKDKRSAVIGRIKIDFTRVGAAAPTMLDGLAACTGTTANQAQTTAGGQNNGQQNNGGQNNNGQNNGGQNNGQQNGGQQNNGGAAASPAPSASAPANIGGQAGNGPVAADFVDITKVAPNVQGKPQKGANASRGTFTTQCGVNANKNFNTDNVIVAPGVTNGAHHLHDYVGNQKVNAFSSNQTFLQGGTSCQNKSDLSSYYWPVVRIQNGTQDFDQNKDGGGKEGNVGKILTPVSAQIKYVGSPASKVVAMPQFLRIITGDAKTTTNGLANANAHWSCTGFENKVQLTSQYPICPQGSKVVRTFAFQSCWDGQNIDSANHRTHVAFPDPASGVCGNGFKAIPQLTMRLTYNIAPPTIQNGVVKNAYAVDGFPEQLHKAATDHDDFISVTTNNLANKIANCINGGRQCR